MIHLLSDHLINMFHLNLPRNVLMVRTNPLKIRHLPPHGNLGDTVLFHQPTVAMVTQVGMVTVAMDLELVQSFEVDVVKGSQ